LRAKGGNAVFGSYCRCDMDIYEHGGAKARIDFSVNINPLGMPEAAYKALLRAACGCDSYPDPECGELRDKISLRTGLKRENIICGNGAADLIFRTAIAAEPKRGLLISPTFSEYERALSAVGCDIDFYSLKEENDFSLGDDFLRVLEGGYDIMFLCNPNNPTGGELSRDKLAEIISVCLKENTFPVIDVSFADFSQSGISSAELAEMGAAVIGSFTKIYAMPALRLGYMLCRDENFIRRVGLSGQSWSVNSLAQAAGAAALEDESFIPRTAEYISRERRFLEERLAQMKIKAYPAAANFILMKSEHDLADIAAKSELALRRCENFRGLDSSFFRTAIKSHEDNMELVMALERGLGIG